MKTKHDKKLNSFHRFYEVMENNFAKWNKTTQLQNSYDKFVKNLKKLDELVLIERQDPSNTREKVFKVRTEIISKLIPVINLIDLYADDNNKKSLKKRMDKVRNQLDGMSNKSLENNVNKISSIALKKLNIEASDKKTDSDLETYGLSQGLIQSLTDQNDKFSNFRKELNDTEKNMKNAEKEIIKRIKENEKLLKNRIDKFMSLYKLNDPELYTAYKNSLITKSNEEEGKSEKTQKEKKQAETKKSIPGKAKSTAVRTKSTRTPSKPTTRTRKKTTPTAPKPAVKPPNAKPGSK